MARKVPNRLVHAWNAFLNKDPTDQYRYRDLGMSTSRNPGRSIMTFTNERSILSSIYNRISIDLTMMMIRQVKVDENGRFSEHVKSGLNECLGVEANKDQTPVAFMQDLIISLFDEGYVAVVPVETSMSPEITSGFDIHSLRIGQILQWYPDHVQVRLYNEDTGVKEDKILSKKYVSIIENPFYMVMNEPNSTLSRLRTKLDMLDMVDKQSSSGKLDIIIQLPYVVKTEKRRDEANKRLDMLKGQLKDSQYGIAYTDGTEKITQLNRPAENNLFKQVEYLTSMLYSQLGLSESVFDGTAGEATMLNYYNRTLEPLLNAIIQEYIRKFLTKTARTQGHSIMFFRDVFKLVPLKELGETFDILKRNEILSANEARSIMGMKPSKQEGSDDLRNPNITSSENATETKVDDKVSKKEGETNG